MGRYVRRGSKGIALVDDSGDKPRLRYVFDISDTGTREHSRKMCIRDSPATTVMAAEMTVTVSPAWDSATGS